LLFEFKKGVFYDKVYENVEDLVEYAVEKNNKLFSNHMFQFDYSISQILINDSDSLNESTFEFAVQKSNK